MGLTCKLGQMATQWVQWGVQWFSSAFVLRCVCVPITACSEVSNGALVMMARGFAFVIVVVGRAGGGGGGGFPMCGAVSTPNGIIYNPVVAIAAKLLPGATRSFHSTCGAS